MGTLTAERLRQLLSYDEETGVFTWIVRRKTARLGDVAGCIKKCGYRVIGIDGQHYRAHRLVWLYVHGEWPIGDLDHKDTVKDNNRITNLRIATLSQNSANKRALNKTRLKGVTFLPRCNKWQAAIGKDGKVIYLGLFHSAEAANAAYFTAANNLFGEFARRS